MPGALQFKPKVIADAASVVRGWFDRAGRSSSATRRFVIFGVGRTGSQFLCRMLNCQKDIICASELFSPDEIFTLNGKIKAHLASTVDFREKHPEEFLRRFWSFDTGGACLGFKMFLTHNSEAIECLIADRAIKKIILNRRNKIKRYVSQIVAHKAQCWTKVDDRPTPQVKVYIEPKLLLANVRTNERRYEDIRRRLVGSNQPFSEVFYEDLVSENKIDCLTSVAEFVGCRDIAQSRWSTDVIFKQNSDKLEEIVENYEELKKALSGTELQQFLD